MQVGPAHRKRSRSAREQHIMASPMSLASPDDEVAGAEPLAPVRSGAKAVPRPVLPPGVSLPHVITTADEGMYVKVYLSCCLGLDVGLPT